MHGIPIYRYKEIPTIPAFILSNLKPSIAFYPCNELFDNENLGLILARSFESRTTSDLEMPNNDLVFEDNGGNDCLGTADSLLHQAPR